tara:strand:+ start:19494 stop:21101 length:1608 start_codon:yes stop_codon:yes gene_type:complete
MGGGLIQLVSLGIQDEYLIGNPQITFFKTVYRRHTNFAIETIEQIIDGVKDTETTETVGVVNVARTGDLLTNVYVTCDQSSNGIKGNKLIREVELILGGTLLDKHTGEWMEIYSELYTPESKKLGYKYMTGGFDNNIPNLTDVNQQKIMIPLRFFFCNEHSQALPIIALQYHDITMKFKWGYNGDINRNSGDNSVSCEVWCDYIFLDQDERKRFADSTHEYLIEQLQYKEYISSSRTFDLKFNHPVKCLFWTEEGLITNQKANLHLNGSDRFYQQSKEYFQLKQPFEHFTSIPGNNIKEQDFPQIIKPIPLSYYYDVTNSTVYNLTKGFTWPVEDATITTFPDSGTDYPRAIIDSRTSNDYTEIKFEHTPALTHSLDIKVGDIILTSISVKDPDTVGTDLGQKSITFTSKIDAITNNDMAPETTTVINIKPNNNITIVTTGIYVISIDVIARHHNPLSRCSDLKKNINCYSFALNPEDHQPSGTCNFSKIDDIKLVFNNTVYATPPPDGKPLTVYALNYNVLRIKNGMGGLAYSN